MKRHVNSGIFPFVRFSLNYLKITVTAAFLVSPPVVRPYLERYYFEAHKAYSLLYLHRNCLTCVYTCV